MSLLLRTVGRQPLLRQQIGTSFSKKCIQPFAPASSQAYDEMKEFWDKNRKLNRPLSPHLSIYKPQLTSMLSLLHRATGIAMAVTIPAVAGALLFMPDDFTTYITLIRDMHFGGAIIAGFKYLIAFPFTYHYVNGMRHLAWDWAKGFSLSATYTSGKAVFAVSVLITAMLVHLL